MIAIIGATGFIGSALTNNLSTHGEPLQLLVRDQRRAMQRLGNTSEALPASTTLIVGDMLDTPTLERTLAGADAVYVLTQSVSTKQGRGAGTFADIEKVAFQRIVTTAARAEVKRIITVGLIGASANAANPWVRARASLENRLMDAPVAVTVLRAGLVVGQGSVGFDGILAAATGETHHIRGAGNQRWSYIALNDLLAYLVAVRREPETARHIFDVGSVETPSYRELIARTASLHGAAMPRLRTTPLWALRAAAPLIEHSQGLAPGGLRAAIAHLGDDLIGDPLPIRAIIPRPLLTWDEAVATAVTV